MNDIQIVTIHKGIIDPEARTAFEALVDEMHDMKQRLADLEPQGHDDLEWPLRGLVNDLYPPPESVKVMKVDRLEFVWRVPQVRLIYGHEASSPTIAAPEVVEVKLKQWSFEFASERRGVGLCYVPQAKTLFWMPA